MIGPMTQEFDLGVALRELAGDRELCALAACLLVRQLAPSLDKVRPATRDAVAVIERWAYGEASPDDVERARAAAVEPSPFVVAIYVIALGDPEARRSSLAMLATLVPATLWSATPEAKPVIAAKPKLPLAELMRDPKVARATEAQRARIAATLREVLDGDRDAAIARYRAWVAAGTRPTRAQPVIMHDRLPEKPPTKSEGDRVLIEAVASHLTHHVAKIASVYHDRDARWVHVDVYAIPTDGAVVLATSGMAERPLFPARVDGKTAGVYTELVIELPADWRFADSDLTDPRWFWPIGWLRHLARMPHRHSLAYRPRETTGPMSPPGGPRATDFDAVLFLASSRVPPLAIVGRTIEFLVVCPLYAEELALARSRGTSELLARFAAKQLDPERVDPARPRLA